MTHEEAFLADILADPGDDFPRLAFADYLEETGADPVRAEFIRVQLRLADPTMGPCACFPSRWPGRAYECQGCAFRRRECELLSVHPAHPRWLGRLLFDGHPKRYMRPDDGAGVCLECVGPADSIRCFFRRGFVEAVTLPCAAFLAHAAALFRAAPITAVRLTDREPGRIGGRHYWLRSAELGDVPPGRPWRLPGDLAYAMNAAERRAGHATPEAAHAFLSAACVTLGRRLAGLPALALA